MRTSLGMPVFVLVSGMAASALAAPIELGTATIEFDPGPGFCLLDREAHDFDRAEIELQERVQAGNLVLAMFMECGRLELLRTGETDEPGIYGVLIAPLDDSGLLTPMPPGTRSGHLEDMATYLGAEPDEATAEFEAGIEDARDALASEELGDLNVSGAQLLGVLGRDDDALYLGMVANVQRQGAARRMLVVTGFTVVFDYLVFQALAQQLSGEGDIEVLLDMARPIMSRLVADNPSASD